MIDLPTQSEWTGIKRKMPDKYDSLIESCKKFSYRMNHYDLRRLENEFGDTVKLILNILSEYKSVLKLGEDRMEAIEEDIQRNTSSLYDKDRFRLDTGDFRDAREEGYMDVFLDQHFVPVSQIVLRVFEIGEEAIKKGHKAVDSEFSDLAVKRAGVYPEKTEEGPEFEVEGEE